MAIVSVRKLFPSRGGKDTWTRKRTYTRVYEVVTDDVTDQEEEVANAEDPVTHITVPSLYDTLDVNDEAQVTNIDADQSDDSPYLWYVTVTYDTEPENAAENEPDTPGGGDGQAAGAPPSNPLERAASWKITSVDKQEVVRAWLPIKQDGSYNYYTPPAWVTGTVYTVGTFVKDGAGAAANVYLCSKSGVSGITGPAGIGGASGIPDGSVIWERFATLAQATTDPRFAIRVPIVNSGKMPPDPPPMTDVSYPVINITMNVEPGFLSLVYAMQIKNCVNLTAWRGVPPRCAKIIKFELGGSETQNKVNFCDASWDIQLDPDTFDLQLLDQGYGSLQLRTVPNPAPPPATIQKLEFFPFRDAAGAIMESPVPMNGAGGKLPAEADPVILRGVPAQQKLADFNDPRVLPFG